MDNISINLSKSVHLLFVLVVLIKFIILSRGEFMTLQRTFIMVKPDGVKRGLIGEIIKRFEQKGFTLLNAELMTVDRTKAEYHYMEHREQAIFR